MSNVQAYHVVSPAHKASITYFDDVLAKVGRADREFSSPAALFKVFQQEPLERDEKEETPLFSRAHCEGPRAKRNLRGPRLLVLDLDGAAVPLQRLSERLDILGVNHAIYTTWSHGLKPGHRLRVVTDLVFDDQAHLEAAARELHEDINTEPNPDSWNAFWFYLPAVHPDRKAGYECEVVVEDEGSTWRPTREPEERQAPEAADKPVEDVDIEDVREWLDAIDVDELDYQTWFEVCAALHWTGHEQAFTLFDEWSATSENGKYRDGKRGGSPEETWDSCHADGGVTLGTLKRLAREHGWEETRQDPREAFSEHLAEPDDGDSMKSPKDRALEVFNEKYAYVAVGRGVVANLRAVKEPVIFMQKSAFLDQHLHPKFPSGVVKADGTPVLKGIGELWYHWKSRPTYTGRDFLPPGGPETLAPDILNLWRGWPYKPGPGSCDLFLRHILDVICSGEQNLYDWILTWMAHLVQKPYEKPGTCIVLKSDEGTGKGIFAKGLVKLCGVHGVRLGDEGQLTQTFNAHLQNRLLVFADEVTWGGRKMVEGTLKGMVTDEDRMYQPKGIDASPGRDFSRLIIAGNKSWQVPASTSARRWQVLATSEERIGDRRYFDAIVEELRNGGYQALMRLLIDLDMDDYPDPTTIIKTDALRDQKLESLDSIGSWLMSVLAAGRLDDLAEAWPEWAASSTIRGSYLEHSREVGVSRRSVEMDVLKRLREVFGCEVKTGRRTIGGQQVRAVCFPPLDRGRALFDVWLGSEVDWEDDDG